MLLGMALSILELQIPGTFFLLGFGVSAVVIGVLVGAGVAAPAWLQWLLFTVLSTASILLLRRALLHEPTSTREIDDMVGMEAIVTEDVPAGGVGKAEMRGTTWTARNAGDVTLGKGQRCRVARVEGLTLWLRLP
jgi:membrane protein implicated in regulation of membrane protease activity